MEAPPQAFITITRKASKHHKCCECLQTIEKGQRYQYSSGIWDHGPDSFKQCLTCNIVMDEAVTIDSQDWQEGVSFGSVADWFIDNIEEISQSLDEDVFDKFVKLHNISINP